MGEYLQKYEDTSVFFQAFSPGLGHVYVQFAEFQPADTQYSKKTISQIFKYFIQEHYVAIWSCSFT